MNGLVEFWGEFLKLFFRGVCLLIPAHEYEMRDPLVYLLIVKY